MIDAVTKALGLVRQYNPLATAPGALSIANDCVIRRENIIENRRGYKVAGANTTYNLDKGVFNFDGYAVFVDSNGALKYLDSGTITNLNASTTLAAHSGHKIRGVEAFQNAYINDSTGVRVLDGVTDSTGNTRYAGAPRALDMSYTLTSGATGFLDDQFQCAYRHLIKRTDPNGNVHFGYPSQRLWVVNDSGAAENANVTVTLANDVEAGDVLQVYRTGQVSGIADDTSGDEMGLVYEYTISASDVSTGTITFTDSITDTLIGASLYTNPSEQGIQQGNTPPPIAKDIALYKSKFMFFANTKTINQLTFALVGTGSLSGKSLTIAGIDYEFGATEILSGAGSPQIQVSATGVAAVDIDQTARSLVRVINRYALNTQVYAYYLSGPDDLPGQILLQRQSGTTGAFTVLAEDTAIGAMTFPESPVGTASTAMTSSNDQRLNGLYYAKDSQPESVPLLNFIPVGPANKEIVRIVPLRDSLIIVSEAGIFRLTGEDPGSFTVTTLDDTIECKAFESVKVLANQAMMLSNQGVVRISENGVEVISREIEIEVQKLLNYDDIGSYTRGAAYESERSYLLSTISENSKTTPDITFVYNVFTRTWVKWTFGMEDAIVEDRTDKLYHSQGELNLYTERKDLTDDDFADPETNITIDSISGDVANVTSTKRPEIGDVVGQGGVEADIAVVIDLGGDSFQLDFGSGNIPASWEANPAVLYPAVDMDIEYLSWSGGQPATMKQVRTVVLLTDDTDGENTATAIQFKFKTNFDDNQDLVRVERPRASWGVGAWGLFPWGGNSDSFNYPTFVPINKQYCNRMFVGFKHRVARQKLAIAGMAYEFDMVSEEVGR